MIELYPHVLVLSTLYPQGAQDTVSVVEFYNPEKSLRRAVMVRSVSATGPYHAPLEDGMQIFTSGTGG